MSNEPSINIGDSWKSISDIKINIGDAWKDVKSIQINIGDVWKTAWEKEIKASYFKVRYRTKTDNPLSPNFTYIGVVIPGVGNHQLPIYELSTTWVNGVTAKLEPSGAPFTAADLEGMLVQYESASCDGGRIYYISEIEVDIYDSDDNLLDTVKPNADDTIRWEATGSPHYAEVNNGISTANDAKYVYDNVSYEKEYLDLENPSW